MDFPPCFSYPVQIGITTDVPAVHIVISLGSTVVLPLLAGQLMRRYLWLRIKKLNIPFGTLSSGVLLLIIYTAFCDTFSSHFEIDRASLGALVAIIVACITLFTITAFLLAEILGFERADIICMMFSATHKSLTLGMPMIKIIFEGNPHVSLISLPLLMYHPSQIMLGSLVVPMAKAWMEAGRRKTAFGASRQQRGFRLSSMEGPPSPVFLDFDSRMRSPALVV